MERPLRTALVHGRGDALLWARRCALRSGADVVLVVDAHDRRGLAERAGALRDADPQCLLVVGGDRDARALADVVEAARAASAGADAPPRVVSAGPPAVQEAVVRASAGVLSVAEAMPPRSDAAASASALLRHLRRLDAPLALADFEERVLGLDLPEVLACELADDAARLAFWTREGIVGVEVHGPGLGAGADAVARRAGIASVRRWLASAVDPALLRDRVANLARWSVRGPAAPALRLALTREALRLTSAAARAAYASPSLARPATLVLSGALAALDPPVAAVAAVLDGMELTGAFRVLRGDQPLGIVIAHAPRRGALAVRIDREREISVRSGEVALETLASAVRVHVPRTGLEVTGAGLLVIDARTRPLAVPSRDGDRLPLVAAWAGALGLPA